MSAGALKQATRGFSPAYFALVMATGIVSVDAQLLALPRIANGLFWLNIVAYAAIWALTALRAVWFPGDLWRDLIDHTRGPGFFTSVAASAVLGSQFVLLANDYRVATLLWVISLALWIVLTYGVFAAFTIKREKPALDEGISGAWLLAVVAPQSIAVLSAYLAVKLGSSHRIEFNFLALSMWLWGGMLYIWIIGLIFYRYTFFRLASRDFTPPYWISMGAMAISTLAGSLLIVNASDAPLLESLAPFIKGFTVFYWVTGTWWIPMLVVLAFWRHVHARVPLRYDALSWGAVFPLGMYAACTFELTHALKLEFMYPILDWLGYVALAAWALAFVGMVRALARVLAAQARGSG